jgi:ankyrin repeat protein
LSNLSLSFAPKGTRFIPSTTSEESALRISVSERTTPPPLPAAGPLNSWRGKALVTDGVQIEIALVERGPERCVIDFHLPDREPGDAHYLDFYVAFPKQVWHHCPEARLPCPDRQGRIIFEVPDERSCNAVERAVREVKSLISFMQLIGGDLSHICGWLNNNTQMICDLHEVLGPAGFQSMPDALGETLQGEAVRNLAKCFAESGRHDLALAMLDLALRDCRNPPGDLSRQWIWLATEALEQDMDVPEITQIVAQRLLRSKPRWLDANERTALTRLANPLQLLSPISESRREDDALSRQTPSPSPLIWDSPGPGAVAAARACLHDLFVGVGVTDLGLIETSDLSRPSGGSMPSDACIDLPGDIDRLEDTEAANKKLILACNAGDLAKVQECIAMGANANATDLYGQTALIFAARAGHKSTVEFLANHGANVNEMNRHFQTPLIVAAGAGHESIVGFLLVHGANANASDEYDQTPLIIAAHAGHKDIVEYLIAHGAEVNSCNRSNDTPLMLASAAGHSRIVALLLSNDAKIETRSTAGMTALMLAAQHNRSNVVDVLISGRANWDARDPRGRTAEQLAEEQGHHELAFKLRQLAEEKGHHERVEKPEKLGQRRSKRLRFARSVKEQLFRRPTKKRKLKK